MTAKEVDRFPVLFSVKSPKHFDQKLSKKKRKKEKRRSVFICIFLSFPFS